MIKTASVFSNDMVLQRGKNVRIWGTYSNCERIFGEIRELGIKSEAILLEDKWTVIFPPMSACESCTVEIYNENDEKIVFENVAIGEVWLAGGQSNMELELQNSENGASELKRCSDSGVRFYYTPKCAMVNDELLQKESESCWQVASEENSKAWSAVGYYFAKSLSHKLGVTVGIIGCNWGGTSASSWVDSETLEKNVYTAEYMIEYQNAVEGKTEEQMLSEYEEYLQYDIEWNKKAEKCYAEKPDISWSEVQEICGVNKWPGPMGIANPFRPCALYESMIKRIAPYTLAGFIYYQGEADEDKSDTYYTLLSALIQKWRSEWLDDKLPFQIVQLPMFRYKDAPDTKRWAKIRQAQQKVFDTVKNTGLAVIIDCGELDNIHPKDKKPVGERLALQAMYNTYHCAKAEDVFPPMYKSCIRKGNDIEIEFDYCDGFNYIGLLSGFEIASYDGEFVKASVKISGNKIRVYSSKVAEPYMVRYLWTDYSEVSFYGMNGLPLPPFSCHI